MEKSQLKKTVDSFAISINNDLRKTIDFKINDLYANEVCKYAIENICSNRERAFLIYNVAKICNIEDSIIRPFLLSSELLIISIYIKDDIIDGNSKREGNPSLHFKYGIDSAILVSDILYSLSFDEIQRANGLVSDEKVLKLLSIHNNCYRNICFGQIIGNKMDTDKYTVNNVKLLYDQLIGDTYKYFFGIPCLISDHPDSTNIIDLGRLCGIASQIRNDIEDIAGDNEKLGIDILLDIIFLQPNYIVALLNDKMGSFSKDQKKVFLYFFGKKDKNIISEEYRDKLFKLLIDTSVLNDTLSYLVELCKESINILNQLPKNEWNTNIGQYVRHLKYEDN